MIFCGAPLPLPIKLKEELQIMIGVILQPRNQLKGEFPR